MYRNRKALVVNASIVLFLVIYALLGGYIFLHFEYNWAQHVKYNETIAKKRCIEELLTRNRELRHASDDDLATFITDACLIKKSIDPRFEWSYKSATLYGIGILTTLGYGKVEPATPNGRIFTVIFGFIGIPPMVIVLTNLGRYIERLALRLKRSCTKKKQEEDELSEYDTLTGSMLFFIVILYLVLGAFFIPLLNGKIDFFNGIYFAFICLTAIEYGDLIPNSDSLAVLAILYMCVGLALSTIALDIGSIYVRKLHYLGRKLRNIANIRIWFGAKDLNVRELINAVGQDIGIGEQVIADIDLDTLVKTAIQVKLGRIPRVPQSHMIVEGIWPPELVPLFMKDGQFPLFVDSEDDLLDLKPRKSVVRFEYESLHVSHDVRSALSREADDFPPVDEISESDSATENVTTELTELPSSRISPPPQRRSSWTRREAHPPGSPHPHKSLSEKTTPPFPLKLPTSPPSTAQKTVEMPATHVSKSEEVVAVERPPPPVLPVTSPSELDSPTIADTSMRSIDETPIDADRSFRSIDETPPDRSPLVHSVPVYKFSNT